MKKIALVFCLGVVLHCIASGQTKYVYTDASTLPLYGKIVPETFEPYSRMPLSMKDSVITNVWNLARSSSGLMIRFSSDAGDFSFKWTSAFKKTYANMTPITVRGMALYVLDDGKWMYLTSLCPNKDNASSEAKAKASKLVGHTREYMLYLSLYDGVKELQIGVPEGRSITASALNTPRREKAVIAYGTSILQGASASHPGMCSTAQLSRRLDRVVINLGFSGNCRLEESVARFMASYDDPGLFIIDNWNGGAEIGEKGLEKCIRTLRKAHPEVSVIIVDRALKPGALFDDGLQEEFDSKTKVAADVVAKLRREGDKKVHHITPYIIGRDNSGTSDGTHFTDDAFTKWVDAVLPVATKAYRTFE